MDKKKTGSFYTPNRLSEIVANYCLSKLSSRERISILEPSVGNGSFIKAIKNSEHIESINKLEITVVEQDQNELLKALAIDLPSKANVISHHTDYLQFHFSENRKYDLFIGNPPYVKKSHLSEEQKQLARSIHAEVSVLSSSIKNIWTSFLLSGIGKLEDDGMIALILPLELLQVKFTEEIRALLKNEFSRLEIFTFNDLQFQECKGQDTVLLIGYKKHSDHGTFYANIGDLEDLENNSYIFNQNISRYNVSTKWTHHLLLPDEYDFLENLRQKLHPVSHYLSHKPGVVTAANKFFIVDQDTVSKYHLEKFAKPILQKGFFINGSLKFTHEDFNKLVENGKPAFLLDFNLIDCQEDMEVTRPYLNIGLKLNIPDSYKCKLRKLWYQIPNISTVPQGFFFKRSHDYPKLIKNDAEVLVTDTAYKLEIKEGYNIEDIFYSFYNSLTLVFSELEGRYYGGGVLELTPNEFRTLPIPYLKCDNFRKFCLAFEEKKSISNILSANNYNILNGTLGLNKTEIDKIEKIRIKLLNKRQRRFPKVESSAIVVG